MIVGVLTTCHTQCTWDSSICIFFYLIEQYSKFLLHTLQVLYMCTFCDSAGLFKMIVGVLTTCHTQYTSDSSICVYLFSRTTLQVFVTYLTGALYVHLLWFYRMSVKSFPDYKHILQQNYCMWNTFFFPKCNSRSFLQHISTLQHVLLLLHGERLIDNQFLSTCSPTCLQLL